jgi:hypothetical protein
MQWETILFWAGTGVLLVTTAVSQTDWKHRTLIWSLMAAGAICIVLAVLGAAGAWPFVVRTFPNVAVSVTAIASSPVAWFAVVVLALTANLIIKSTDQSRPSILASVIGKLKGAHPADPPIVSAVKAPAPPPRTPQLDQDILHLLDFGVYQTTLVMLSYLVDQIPKKYDIDPTSPFPTELANDKARNDADIYLETVRRLICDGSERARNYEGIWLRAEGEAERLLRQTPQDERPPEVDPLILRDYAISFRRAVYTAMFLRAQRREIETIVIRQRSTLIERFRTRQE